MKPTVESGPGDAIRKAGLEGLIYFLKRIINHSSAWLLSQRQNFYFYKVVLIWMLCLSVFTRAFLLTSASLKVRHLISEDVLSEPPENQVGATVQGFLILLPIPFSLSKLWSPPKLI